MTSTLDGLCIDINCHLCGRKTQKAIDWIKANLIYVCSCGADIDLKSDYFAAEIRKAEAVNKGLVSSTQSLGN